MRIINICTLEYCAIKNLYTLINMEVWRKNIRIFDFVNNTHPSFKAMQPSYGTLSLSSITLVISVPTCLLYQPDTSVTQFMSA